MFIYLESLFLTHQTFDKLLIAAKTRSLHSASEMEGEKPKEISSDLIPFSTNFDCIGKEIWKMSKS